MAPPGDVAPFPDCAPLFLLYVFLGAFTLSWGVLLGFSPTSCGCSPIFAIFLFPSALAPLRMPLGVPVGFIMSPGAVRRYL